MRRSAGALAVHATLAAYTVLALFPIVLVISNSLKTRKVIFGDPLALPTPSTFSLVGYEKVFSDASVASYYLNSIFVTGGTISSGSFWFFETYRAAAMQNSRRFVSPRSSPGLTMQSSARTSTGSC